MPLRDHFRPPVSTISSWEGFHGQWPANIVQQLRKQLPPGFVAEPRVRLGNLIEVDVGALERDGPTGHAAAQANGTDGTIAAAAWPAVNASQEVQRRASQEVQRSGSR